MRERGRESEKERERIERTCLRLPMSISHFHEFLYHL